jgi:ketosteroid isomerase-like protein
MQKFLQQKLEVLIAKDEIREVLTRYCRGVNRCDADLVASCYHPGALDIRGSSEDTARDGAEWAQIAVQAGLALCQTIYYYITDSTIEVDGDTARCESYSPSAKVLTELSTDGAVQVRLAGIRNLDHFEKRNGEWRIVKRQLVSDWGINTPFGGGPAFPPGAPPAPRGRTDKSDPSYGFWKGSIS